MRSAKRRVFPDNQGVEATMREHLERSLRNLQTDYADVYYPRLMLM